MKDFLNRHLAFILTISVTYALGIALIVVQFFAADENANVDFMELLINSIVPTTITYVLGCVVVNIAEILQGKRDEYIFNIITVLLVFLYALIFCIYLMTGFSAGWIVGELIITIGLLAMNIFCYREKHEHRKHRLV